MLNPMFRAVRRQRVAYAVITSAMLLSIQAATASDTAVTQNSREQLREEALQQITPELIRGHLRFLAHDLLEGRATGERGYEIAREYVASQFTRMGAAPMPDGLYLQPFDVLVGGDDRGSRLRVGEVSIDASDASFMPD